MTPCTLLSMHQWRAEQFALELQGLPCVPEPPANQLANQRFAPTASWPIWQLEPTRVQPELVIGSQSLLHRATFGMTPPLPSPSERTHRPFGHCASWSQNWPHVLTVGVAVRQMSPAS